VSAIDTGSLSLSESAMLFGYGFSFLFLVSFAPSLGSGLAPFGRSGYFMLCVLVETFHATWFKIEGAQVQQASVLGPSIGFWGNMRKYPSQAFGHAR